MRNTRVIILLKRQKTRSFMHDDKNSAARQNCQVVFQACSKHCTLHRRGFTEHGCAMQSSRFVSKLIGKLIGKLVDKLICKAARC